MTDLKEICLRYSAKIIKTVDDISEKCDSIHFSSLDDLNDKLGILRQEFGYLLPIYVLPDRSSIISPEAGNTKLNRF